MDREKDRSADLGRDLPIFVGWEMGSWTPLFTGRIPCTAVSPVAAKSCPFPLAALTRKRRAVSAYRSLIRTKQRSPAQRPGIFALWGGRWDSNPRSSVPQTDALGQLRYTHHIKLARLKGLEPLAPCLEGRCSIQLSYRRIAVSLQGRFAGAGDGNRTHTTSLEGWGSTTELHPRMNCSSQRGLS